MNENEKMNADFYRDKAWVLLMDEIKAIKEAQKEMAADIDAIKRKMAWVFGMAAGITFIFNVAWQWFTAKIQSGK